MPGPLDPAQARCDAMVLALESHRGVAEVTASEDHTITARIRSSGPYADITDGEGETVPLDEFTSYMQTMVDGIGYNWKYRDDGRHIDLKPSPHAKTVSEVDN